MNIQGQTVSNIEWFVGFSWVWEEQHFGVAGHQVYNFGTGRSSQVTTQLSYNCKKVNCLAFVPPKDSSGLCSRKCCGSHAHAKASHSITEASALGRRWTNFKKNGPPQPTLRPKNSKLVCIYYETNYGQHSGTLNAGYFSIIFQAYQINYIVYSVHILLDTQFSLL